MKHPETTKNNVAQEFMNSCIENFDEIQEAYGNLLDAITGIPEEDLSKLSSSKDIKDQEFYKLIGMYYNAINDQIYTNKAMLNIRSLDELNLSEEEDKLHQRLELVGWIDPTDRMKRRFMKRFEMKDFVLFWYFMNALDLYRMGMNYLDMVKKDRPDNCTIPSDRYIDYVDSVLDEIREPLKDVFDELIE